jgi:hypothetical protein
MAGYNGPWGASDLNDWVKKLERQHVSISLVGVPQRQTKPVNWWVLFCGVFEQYDAEITKRSLNDWRSLWKWEKAIALDFIEKKPRWLFTEHTLSLSPKEKAAMALLDTKAKNLTMYIRELPNVFCDLHAVYSRKYIDFVRLQYNTWCDADCNSGPPRGGFEACMEVYVRELLKERDIKVNELKGAE